MSNARQVKVDNWGIYFLQRLKHFFNRTDYCDLTLQFQDNAQLKVHRLVLNACTEYFELLERTCEMYEDCLVMPDDLQADVVVPIVNFMYTGHLEFKMDMLERLYQTSQILNMPVLSKLLESHRTIVNKTPNHQSYGYGKKYTKTSDPLKNVKTSTPVPTTSKRSYSNAFNNSAVQREAKVYQVSKQEIANNSHHTVHSSTTKESMPIRKVLGEPRPTRYEVPEELDSDDIFDNSFCSISYTSQPLMVHPETAKSYSAKRNRPFSEASSSKKNIPTHSTVDIVECKRISKDDQMFDDPLISNDIDDADIFQTSYSGTPKDSSQLFDQILEPVEGPKISIEAKETKQTANIDHAKIISEVLKKYPHLVKSNKNIKLKILDTPSKPKKTRKLSPKREDSQFKMKSEPDTEQDYTYETDVLNSKQAAKLIAMGAENVKGPWICLICGTPGKALHFSTYYKFRRHLVEVHNEKPISNICEYCGLKSYKRNNLLHHLYTAHGIEPPPTYHFPKCNKCSYVALTEGFLVKHKLTHKDPMKFHCNVCAATFNTTYQLLVHIQHTGHKYSADRKPNLQCIYCLKVFLRESNLYAHLKTNHKKEAKRDGVIEDSDEEEMPAVKVEQPKPNKGPSNSNFESITTLNQMQSTNYDNELKELDIQYDIDSKGDIIVSKKSAPAKQKILNTGFDNQKTETKMKPKPKTEPSNFLEDVNVNEDEVVVIDNNEYIVRDNQLIPRKSKVVQEEFILSDMVDSASLQSVQPSTSMDYSNIQNDPIEDDHQSMVIKKSTSTYSNLQNAQIDDNIHQAMVIKKAGDLQQPIQIVVSSEEEYKALIANHPIIFNNGDTNKTLTVLAAPHNATEQGSNIDLNSTQSSDMMLLQDEYPLNVSEAVSAENSNIVVVYSHPVDDPKQQYQILTSAGMATQFVQSSAIITQNYETVTTSTPAMNAVLSPQVDQTWHNNIQSIEQTQQVPLVSEAQLQHISHITHVDATTVHAEPDNLDELPDVTLVPTQQQAASHEMVPVEQQIAQLEVVSVQQQIAPLEVISPQQQITTHEVDPAQQQIAAHDVVSTPQQVEVHEVDSAQEQIAQQEIISESQQITQLEDAPDPEQIAQLEEAQVVELPEQSETMNAEHENQQIEKQTVDEPQNIPLAIGTPMDIDISSESITHQTVDEPITSASTESGIIPEVPVNNQDSESANEAMVTETAIEETSTIVTQENMDHNDIAQDAENDEVTENAQIDTSIEELPQSTPLPESQAYDDIVLPENETESQPPYTKVVEKIQNLTSEWSEDEYDVADDETVENIAKEVSQHNVQPVSEVIAEVTPQTQPELDTGAQELEESIENIQQEVAKQMPAIVKPYVEPVYAPDVSPVEEDVSVPTDLQEKNVPEIETQEKISSLLNDWEDNDSQEENATQDDAQTSTEVGETICEETPAVEDPKTEVIKNDNLKSLVSDWDDDEEEKE